MLRIAKRGFRAVWSARGGGLYACGFLITFLWLEVSTFAREVASADSIGSFITEQLFEFVIRFTVQSLENTVQAFLWPLPIIEWSPVWGGVFLGGLYVIFRQFLKKPLTDWLFGDDVESEGEGRDD